MRFVSLFTTVLRKLARSGVAAALLLCVSYADAAENLKLGVHPYLPAGELTERFTPLLDYLSNTLGKTVKLDIATDYVSHIERTGKDEVDIAYLGPAPYVEMVAQYGTKPLLARLEVKGRSTFKGAIILSPQSPIKTLADLKGKHFAFGSSHSTMSHLVPRYMLMEAGIRGEDLGSFEFLGNHENVVSAVLLGEFDAGAVKESIYTKNQAKGLQLLAWTPPISAHVFVAGNQLPAGEVEAIRNALLNLKNAPERDAVLHTLKKTITGLAAAEDADFENLRVMLQALKAEGIPE